jgi:ubiquinone/menaquinone biosynthesis C-methylase UbiE
MTQSFAGHYPVDNRAGEIERLHMQDAALAPETERMLDLIGVAEGWRCVDLGCGPGGITGLLSRRVGPTGHVVGVDMNRDFLDVAASDGSGNLVFRQDDVYGTALPGASFDLVHTRFVASTAGAPERLLAEARRIARPGGIIALQEPDGSTLNCYPAHPAWDKLKDAFLHAFRGIGADIELARRLYHVARHAGLDDVHYRPFIIGVRANDPMVDYLPSTVGSLRRTIVQLGLMNDAELSRTMADCRTHLAQPDTSFTMYTVAQVWGRNPVAC